jgi:hypothetical protein
MEDMANHTHVNLAAEILKKEQELKKAKREALMALGDLCWSLVTLAFNVALGLFGLCYQGFIISKIWLWFVVPFFKVPPMGVAEMSGLVALLIMLRGVRYSEYKTLKDLSKKDKWAWFVTGLIFESTIFWFAYILKGHL